MKRDVFGKKGDFITSPEISQVFGEVSILYSVHMAKKLSRNKIIFVT